MSAWDVVSLREVLQERNVQSDSLWRADKSTMARLFVENNFDEDDEISDDVDHGKCRTAVIQ